MKCKYCGAEFEQGKGRKREYCYKEECIRKARNEIQRKWYAKKRENISQVEENKIPTVVYSSQERLEHKLNMPNTGDIIEIAKQLGTLRFQLVQMIEKERDCINEYNKADQDFLHRIEALEELTDQEAIDMLIKEKKNRESRRNYKVRYYLIQCLLDSIILKNPSAFIIQTIQKSKDFTYVPRVIEELKQDPNLYCFNNRKIGSENNGINKETGKTIKQSI